MKMKILLNFIIALLCYCEIVLGQATVNTTEAPAAVLCPNNLLVNQTEDHFISPEALVIQPTTKVFNCSITLTSLVSANYIFLKFYYCQLKSTEDILQFYLNSSEYPFISYSECPSTPFNVTLPSSKVQIRFNIVKNANEAKGFYLTYKNINPNQNNWYLTTPPPSYSCANNLTVGATPQYITSPNYPARYPNNARCITYITSDSNSNGILLRILSCDLERRFDFLSVYSYGNFTQRIYYTSDCPYVPYELHLGSSSGAVEFTSDSSVSQTGFRIEVISENFTITNYGNNRNLGISPWCSRNISAYTFTNYVSLLGPSTSDACVNTFQSLPGLSLTLTMSQCNEGVFDQLEIFADYEMTNRPYRLFGCPQLPFTAFLPNGLGVLVYSSSVPTTNKQFQIQYTAGRNSFSSPMPLPPTSCSGSVTANESINYLTSPNYPGLYPNNSTCTTAIHSYNGDFIFIRLRFCEMENNFDKIEIYGDKDLSFLVERLTHCPLLSYRLRVPSNIAVIRFISDSSVNYRGFRLSYTTRPVNYMPGTLELVADYTLKYVASPNYPNNYPNNITWMAVINSAQLQSDSIILTLLNCHLENGFDYLSIFSDEGFTQRVFYTSQCPSVPMRFNFSSNIAIIRLQTDSSNCRGGFRFSYTTSSYYSPNYVGDDNNYTNSYYNTLSTTTIVFIIVGILIILKILIFLGYVLYRKKYPKKMISSSNNIPSVQTNMTNGKNNNMAIWVTYAQPRTNEIYESVGEYENAARPPSYYTPPLTPVENTLQGAEICDEPLPEYKN